MMTLHDQETRDRAATVADRNVVVTAGAGTGKTTLLVDRLLHLLFRRSQPLAIGEIVALTFTNKAANEMKLRLRDRLTGILGFSLSQVSLSQEMRAPRREQEQLTDLMTRYDLTTEQVVTRARAALVDLERSQIGTIHSYAAHLLRLHPVECRVDPFFQEDDGSRFLEHFERQWTEWLDEELGPHGGTHEVWRQILREVELADVKTLAYEFCDELVPLDDSLESWGEDGIPGPISIWMASLATRGRELRAAHAKSHSLERLLEETIRFLDRLGSSTNARSGAPLASQDQDEQEVLCRKIPPRTATWSQEDYVEAISIIKAGQAVAQAREGPLPSLLRLIIPFVRRCRRSFAEAGYVSFSGLLARARDLLKDHPSIRRELKLQINAVLVDEFQDTDPVQYELVLYLAEALGREVRDWKKIQLAPGKLFIVGDPKQSIYAFRRADLEAYDRVVGDLVLAESSRSECHSLQTNFRTHAELLAPLNTCFARLFPEESRPGVQPKHEPLLAMETEDPPLASERIAFRLVKPEDSEGGADAASRAEAETLAKWLGQEVFGREQIRESGAVVSIQPRHVGILFRTLTHVHLYVEALRRYGIPCLTEGEKHFYERQEVVDFVNVMRVVANPHDQVALAGVLRSPLGGLSDRQLEALVRKDGLDFTRTPSSLGDGEPPVYGALRQLSLDLPELPCEEIADALLARLPLVELAAATVDGEQAVGNVLKLRDIIVELAIQSALTLHGIVRMLTKRVRETSPEAENTLVEEGQEVSGERGAVRVLSIHKAKGLEFPMVILAGLHRGIDQRASPVDVQHDWSTNTIGIRLGDLRTVGGVYVGARLEERQRAETLRLLYVAMTRAKRRLILSVGLSENGNPAKDSFLNLLEKGMGLNFEELGSGDCGDRMVSVGEGIVKVQVLPGREAGDQGPGGVHWSEAPEQDMGWVGRWNERRRRARHADQIVLFGSPTTLAAKNQDRSPYPDELTGDLANIESGEERSLSSRVLRDRSQVIGILAHQVLDGWDFASPPQELDRRVTKICERGLPPEWQGDAKGIEQELQEIFQNFLQSPVYGRLQGAKILGQEFPFMIPWREDKGAGFQQTHGPLVMEGVIDLVYRLDDTVWVADFKTDRIQAHDVHARAQRYRGQVLIYGLAISQALGLDQVKCQIIFLRPGQAVDVSITDN